MGNTTYRLIGQEVSKATFEKYSKAKFSFNGNMVSLDSLYAWATSLELAKAMPELAAEARQVLDQVKHELSETTVKINAPKVFQDIAEAFHRVYMEGKRSIESLNNALERAKLDYDLERQSKNATELSIKAAEIQMKMANEDYKKGFAVLKETQKIKTAEIMEQLKTVTADYFLADAQKIDATALQLINSGIMTAADMQNMASQFRGNPTMLKLIDKHAQTAAEKATGGEKVKYLAVSKSLEGLISPESVLNDFDIVARSIVSSVTTNEFMADGWDQRYCEAVETALASSAALAPANAAAT